MTRLRQPDRRQSRRHAPSRRGPESPAVKIGSIEVRVVTPVPPPAPQAPAAAAPTALSRGFASPFGLRQG
jgi:hypothetical protein